MIPSDRERILRENLDLLAGALGDLEGVRPGWARIFERFLGRIQKFNMNTGKNYELRALRIRGLCVQIEWNVEGPIDTGIQTFTRRFKSDVVHTCQICGRPSAFKAPLAGYTFCRDCMQLQLAIQMVD